MVLNETIRCVETFSLFITLPSYALFTLKYIIQRYLTQNWFYCFCSYRITIISRWVHAIPTRKEVALISVTCFKHSFCKLLKLFSNIDQTLKIIFPIIKTFSPTAFRRKLTFKSNVFNWLHWMIGQMWWRQSNFHHLSNFRRYMSQ